MHYTDAALEVHQSDTNTVALFAHNVSISYLRTNFSSYITAIRTSSDSAVQQKHCLETQVHCDRCRRRQTAHTTFSGHVRRFSGWSCVVMLVESSCA